MWVVAKKGAQFRLKVKFVFEIRTNVRVIGADKGLKEVVVWLFLEKLFKV